VPFPPGGNTDTLARMIAPALSTALGTPVVIDNKAGAGGSVGSGLAARAAPDGYTMLGGTISSHAINVSLYAKLDYDPLKSFEPVAMLGSGPLVLAVNASSPYKTLNDVLAASKAKAGGLSSASPGVGTSPHMALELLSYQSGVKFTHVPYKGNAAALTDLLGGNISFMFNLPIDAVPLAREGKVRALGTTGRTRLQLDSSIPTIGESVPGFEVVSWAAVIAPAGLPREITNRLSDEIAKALRAPEMVERLTKQGWEIAYGTPEQAAQTIRNDLVRWGPIVKASGARVD